MTVRHPHGMATASECHDGEAQEASSPGAERVRRCRRRQALGVMVVPSEVDPKVVAGLESIGAITMRQREDRQAIGQALPAAFLDLLALVQKGF